MLLGGAHGDLLRPGRAGGITPKVLPSGIGVPWVWRRVDACSEGVLRPRY